MEGRDSITGKGSVPWGGSATIQAGDDMAWGFHPPTLFRFEFPFTTS